MNRRESQTVPPLSQNPVLPSCLPGLTSWTTKTVWIANMFYLLLKLACPRSSPICPPTHIWQTSLTPELRPLARWTGLGPGTLGSPGAGKSFSFAAGSVQLKVVRWNNDLVFPAHGRNCCWLPSVPEPLSWTPEELPARGAARRGPSLRPIRFQVSRRELILSSMETCSPPGFPISLGASQSKCLRPIRGLS